MDNAEAQALIERIAKVSSAFGMHANVGAMETAGSIVSFLAANPHYLADFLAGGSVIDWPFGWLTAGCLSWHGQDGKIHWPGEREAMQMTMDNAQVSQEARRNAQALLRKIDCMGGESDEAEVVQAFANFERDTLARHRLERSEPVGWMGIESAPKDEQILAAIKVNHRNGDTWWERHVIVIDSETGTISDMDFDHGWDAGHNEDYMNIGGPFKTREEAIAEGRHDRQGEPFYICNAALHGWTAPDADCVMDHWVDDHDELWWEDGFCGFDGGNEAEAIARDDLQTVLNAWFQRHRAILPTPTAFCIHSDGEWIDRPAPVEEPKQ